MGKIRVTSQRLEVQGILMLLLVPHFLFCGHPQFSELWHQNKVLVHKNIFQGGKCGILQWTLSLRYLLAPVSKQAHAGFVLAQVKLNIHKN